MKPFRTPSVPYCFSPTVSHLWHVPISQLPFLARYTSYIIVCTAIIFILHQGLRDGLSWVTDVTGLDKVTGQDFFFSCPLYFFRQSFSSSYFLMLFHCLISILLFRCASVWENTREWVPPFSLAILNGTYFLQASILYCGDVPSPRWCKWLALWPVEHAVMLDCMGSDLDPSIKVSRPQCQSPSFIHTLPWSVS